MKGYSKTLLLLFTISIISCNPKNREAKKQIEQQIGSSTKIDLDSLNKSEAQKLSLKWDAITAWDTTVKFTFQLQELVNKNNKPISFICSIKDIVKNDSNFILKVYGRFSNRNSFGDILVTSAQLHALYKLLDTNTFSNKGCLIFTPTNIASNSMMSIASETSEAENMEDVSSYLTYDFSKILIHFRGKLIDFYFYKH